MQTRETDLKPKSLCDCMLLKEMVVSNEVGEKNCGVEKYTDTIRHPADPQEILQGSVGRKDWAAFSKLLRVGVGMAGLELKKDQNADWAASPTVTLEATLEVPELENNDCELVTAGSDATSTNVLEPICEKALLQCGMSGPVALRIILRSTSLVGLLTR